MRLKQQQTPEKKLPQMLQKTTKTATNAGDFPENVPQLRKFSNKRRRKNSRKCSTYRRIKNTAVVNKKSSARCHRVRDPTVTPAEPMLKFNQHASQADCRNRRHSSKPTAANPPQQPQQQTRRSSRHSSRQRSKPAAAEIHSSKPACETHL